MKRQFSTDDKIFYKFYEFADEVMSPKKIFLTLVIGVFVISGLYLSENPDSIDRLPIPNETTDNTCEDVPTISGYTYNYSQLVERCNCLNGTLETRDVNRSNTSNIYCEIG